MSILLLLLISALANARGEDFPDKEPRFRCDNRKVSACIDENSAGANYVENEMKNLRNQMEMIQTELSSAVSQKSILDGEYRRISFSRDALRNELEAEKSEKKSDPQAVFPGGPMLFELKIFSRYDFSEEESDKITWNNTLQQEIRMLEEKMDFLSPQILSLSNNISNMNGNIAQFTQEIQVKETQKRQHVNMCESGCKMRFCPES